MAVRNVYERSGHHFQSFCHIEANVWYRVLGQLQKGSYDIGANDFEVEGGRDSLEYNAKKIQYLRRVASGCHTVIACTVVILNR